MGDLEAFFLGICSFLGSIVALSAQIQLLKISTYSEAGQRTGMGGILSECSPGTGGGGGGGWGGALIQCLCPGSV